MHGLALRVLLLLAAAGMGYMEERPHGSHLLDRRRGGGGLLVPHSQPETLLLYETSHRYDRPDDHYWDVFATTLRQNLAAQYFHHFSEGVDDAVEDVYPSEEALPHASRQVALPPPQQRDELEKCNQDGLFYESENSFVICTNGNRYVQRCPPGTKNYGYARYEHSGGRNSHMDFCGLHAGASASEPPSHGSSQRPYAGHYEQTREEREQTTWNEQAHVRASASEPPSRGSKNGNAVLLNPRERERVSSKRSYAGLYEQSMGERVQTAWNEGVHESNGYPTGAGDSEPPSRESENGNAVLINAHGRESVSYQRPYAGRYERYRERRPQTTWNEGVYESNGHPTGDGASEPPSRGSKHERAVLIKAHGRERVSSQRSYAGPYERSREERPQTTWNEGVYESNGHPTGVRTYSSSRYTLESNERATDQDLIANYLYGLNRQDSAHSSHKPTIQLQSRASKPNSIPSKSMYQYVNFYRPDGKSSLYNLDVTTRDNDCLRDGLFFKTDTSFVLCSNGYAYVHHCPPGTKNHPHTRYMDAEGNRHADFCGLDIGTTPLEAFQPTMKKLPRREIYETHKVSDRNALKEGLSCKKDGLSYKDEVSFLVCTNGNGYVQHCPPGTKNEHINKYRRETTFSHRDFCSLNIAAQEYTAASATSQNSKLDTEWPSAPDKRSCTVDGLSFRDETSYFVCYNGQSHVQACPPGMKNGAQDAYGGEASSSHHDFCTERREPRRRRIPIGLAMKIMEIRKRKKLLEYRKTLADNTTRGEQLLLGVAPRARDSNRRFSNRPDELRDRPPNKASSSYYDRDSRSRGDGGVHNAVRGLMSDETKRNSVNRSKVPTQSINPPKQVSNAPPRGVELVKKDTEFTRHQPPYEIDINSDGNVSHRSTTHELDTRSDRDAIRQTTYKLDTNSGSKFSRREPYGSDITAGAKFRHPSPNDVHTNPGGEFTHEYVNSDSRSESPYRPNSPHQVHINSGSTFGDSPAPYFYGAAASRAPARPAVTFAEFYQSSQTAFKPLQGRKGIFHGQYFGICAFDGLYYKNETSFLFCSNGFAYVENCDKGTMNMNPSNYANDMYYASSDFCTVKLQDYAADGSRDVILWERPRLKKSFQRSSHKYDLGSAINSNNYEREQQRSEIKQNTPANYIKNGGSSRGVQTSGNSRDDLVLLNDKSMDTYAPNNKMFDSIIHPRFERHHPVLDRRSSDKHIFDKVLPY